MKALISPNEVFNYTWISEWILTDSNKWEPVYSTINDCVRVAQVVDDNSIFDVASPFFWNTCPEDCNDSFWYYKDGQFYLKPSGLCEPSPVE